MSDQEGYILQSITMGGQEFDLSYVAECAYIETFDLSGPKLVIKLHDRVSFVRDELGVDEGKEITVRLADPFVQDGMDAEQSYTVAGMNPADGVAVLNCVQSGVWAMKRPTDKPQFFVEKPYKEILSAVAPDNPAVWQKNVTSYTRGDNRFGHSMWPDRKLASKNATSYCYGNTSDYHLIEGFTPSKFIRKLARHAGCQVFVNREQNLIFRKLCDFAGEERVFLDYEDRSADTQILQYRQIRAEQSLKQRIERNYRGWDMLIADNDGRIKGETEESCSGEKLPMEMTGFTETGTLDNLNEFAVPVLDMVCSGDGNIRPGKRACLTWHTPIEDNGVSDERPFDESMPAEVLVGSVSHFYTPQMYHCRIMSVKLA